MSDARAISGVRRTRRQRRPSGAPPPLPCRIGPSTTASLALAAILVSAAFLVSELTPWQRAGDQASTWLLRHLAAARTPGLTGPAESRSGPPCPAGRGPGALRTGAAC